MQAGRSIRAEIKSHGQLIIPGKIRVMSHREGTDGWSPSSPGAKARVGRKLFHNSRSDVMARFLFSMFVAVSVLVCSIANAEVYDDFRGENIDASKWTVHSTSGSAPGLFTQSKGRLYFSCNRDAGESLISTKSFAAGFLRIEFSDFYSTNDAPPRRGMGSYVALGLGPKDNYVRMLRGRVITGGYFEANYFANNSLQLWYESTAVSSGQLALYYDGSTVSFFYNNGLNPDRGWQRVGPKVTPGWNSPPSLFIGGYPGASGRTSFAVHKVEYLPLPLPPSLQKKLEK